MLGSMESFPGQSKVWVFGVSRPLDPAEGQTLVQIVSEYLREWTSHGAPVVGACELHGGTLLVVAADDRGDASGCSVDKLFATLQRAEDRLGVKLLDSTRVFYRTRSGEIASVSRPEFRALVGRGEIGAATRVFDNSISTLAELRAGGWEKPAERSWHAEAFGITVNA